ncbi:hypothetical protein RHO12_11555 [Orbus sturtevantii]|uniref:hypothetical protein n=1 Tax=Orbus sturtevantii TaxID=3074109 RepID=UPI00370D98DA
MKNFLFIILICISNSAFCDIKSTDDISLEMKNRVNNNSMLIKNLNNSFIKNNINIFYSEWARVLDKKCNWVKANINIELYGQEDKFSYQLCIITEQNSFINQLAMLMKEKKINSIENKELEEFKTELSAQVQQNVYFNYLTENYANKFCHNFNDHEIISNCISSFILHQFIPEDYDFKIVNKEAYLLNAPSQLDKTKMYLVTGDKVRLLQRQDDFYLIEYNSQKKGLIHKWLQCSAIDAC